MRIISNRIERLSKSIPIFYDVYTNVMDTNRKKYNVDRGDMFRCVLFIPSCKLSTFYTLLPATYLITQ